MTVIAARPDSRYDAVAARDCHRISAIYSVEAARTVAEDFTTEFAEMGEPASDYLKLDRLRSSYDLARRQLPRVLCRADLEGSAIGLGSAPVAAERGFVWLVALPHGDLLLALTVEVACSLERCIGVMEDLHHRRVEVASRGLWAGCASRLAPEANGMLEGMSLGPDTYQLLFVSAAEHERLKDRAGEVNTAAVSSLVYRYVGDYEHQTVRVVYPPESNRGRYLAATGPYVGVVSGLQDHVENAAFISALQYLGSAALLRKVRLEAFDELVRLRRLIKEGEGQSRRTRRAVFAQMARRLGHLQLELSFGVEAFDGIASLIPSLRVLDFHAALFDSANTTEEATTVSGMLSRLEHALHAEIEKLQAEERSADERRRSVMSAATGLVTAVALPLGILFGFLGITAKEVSAENSFLAWSAYRGVYLGLAALAAIALLAGAGAWLKFRVTDARDRRAQGRLLRESVDAEERAPC